jgi:lipopolysaccharide/colanic/teichoic acid biosynthesis glycosyltransferase
MALLFPSSRGTFRIHLSASDVFWAALAPPLALYFRDAYILSSQGVETAALYCGLSFAVTILAFLTFRIGDGMSRYFSAHDAISVVKAVAAAGLTTSVVLFTLTRLEGIPRTTPILHVLILTAGLLITRTVMMVFDKPSQSANNTDPSTVEHIIMIGSSSLTSLYINLLRAYSPDQRHVIAVLDDDQKLLGRAMCGVPVVASSKQLDPVIDEFAVHGVRTDRVIIGGDEHLLSPGAMDQVRRICQQRDIVLEFVPKLVGLDLLRSVRQNVPFQVIEPTSLLTAPLSNYFRNKRIIDFIVAFMAIIVFLPLFLIASVLILFDIGSPVVFWQKRVGQNGRNFLLYKFRTLRSPFDREGNPASDCDRISIAGRLLRTTRLDELPQLLNVLVGEMSLIGPRPLLPCDQPKNSTFRLMVRPGITGWAQINGGNLITTEEKGALDDWYIHNASLRLDLRIALLTIRFLFTGERRSEAAVSEANSLQWANGHSKRPVDRPANRPVDRNGLRGEVTPASNQAAAVVPVTGRAKASQAQRLR